MDVAVEALAVLGAVFWSVQLLPQIWLNYKRASTEGLSSAMMILWSIAGLPLGIHNILSNQHLALQIQAQILTGLSLATWSQTMYYGHKWTGRRCVCWLVGLVVLFGAMETAVVVGVKYGDVSSAQHHSIVLAMAIISAILLALGVLRHYWDIYIHRTVRGISWGFVFLDALGDLTSMLAIVWVKPIDPAATSIYAVELALWIGIMIAGLLFNAPTVLRRMLGKGAAPDAQEAVMEEDEQETQFETSSAFSSVRRSLPRRVMHRLRHV